VSKCYSHAFVVFRWHFVYCPLLEVRVSRDGVSVLFNFLLASLQYSCITFINHKYDLYSVPPLVRII
jgi:hypothetical protein